MIARTEVARALCQTQNGYVIYPELKNVFSGDDVMAALDAVGDGRVSVADLTRWLESRFPWAPLLARVRPGDLAPETWTCAVRNTISCQSRAMMRRPHKVRAPACTRAEIIDLIWQRRQTAKHNDVSQSGNSRNDKQST